MARASDASERSLASVSSTLEPTVLDSSTVAGLPTGEYERPTYDDFTSIFRYV
jgi:hypothetical protein